MERFVGFFAGPYSLAAPITSVRQILAVETTAADDDVPAAARLLGAEPLGRPQAVLSFDGEGGAVFVSCCKLRGVVDAKAPVPLPGTVACRHPGLLSGTIDDGEALTLVVDPRVLVGLVAARNGGRAR